MTKHLINVLIGKRLKAARNTAGLDLRSKVFTRQELGDKMGVGRIQVAYYEQGVTPISIVRLVDICNIFKLPIDYFVHDLVEHFGENSPLTLPKTKEEKRHD